MDLEIASVCFSARNSVGVASSRIIPDKQMTASSHYGGEYRAAFGRLHGRRGDGWCARNQFGTKEWLQVDLGKTVKICGVATQGDIANEGWVTDFKLSYSDDGGGWTIYLDADGSQMVRLIIYITLQ